MENKPEPTTAEYGQTNWHGSPASGSASFAVSQRAAGIPQIETAPGPAPEPTEENVVRARIKMAADNAGHPHPPVGVEWRQGDWLFWVYPGNEKVLAFFSPPPPPTKDIDGKMAAYRQWCSPEELAAMDRIADGEPPGPLVAEVESLRKKLAALEKKEANRELAEMDDILRGGDGDLPQSNEQVIARILGDTASYGQVLRLTKLLDRTETFAVDGLKRELGDAKKEIAELKRAHAIERGKLYAEIERLSAKQATP